MQKNYFTFKQSSRVEFSKDEKALKETIFVDPWLDSNKVEFDCINVDEILDNQHNELSTRVKNWTYEGSVWTFYSILQRQPVILEITPWEGSFNFLLPKELNNSMRGLINIQNDDNECFRWCLDT